MQRAIQVLDGSLRIVATKWRTKMPRFVEYLSSEKRKLWLNLDQVISCQVTAENNVIVITTDERGNQTIPFEEFERSIRPVFDRCCE
jgi:hypothetical protein